MSDFHTNAMHYKTSERIALGFVDARLAGPNVLTDAFRTEVSPNDGPPHPSYCQKLWASREERGMAYIAGFVGEYTHVTYPSRRVTGWEEVLLEQRRADLMARHFRASFQ